MISYGVSAPVSYTHLDVYKRQDVGLPVVDLVEVRHRLEPAVQPPGVLIAGVVVATDQVLVTRDRKSTRLNSSH